MDCFNAVIRSKVLNKLNIAQCAIEILNKITANKNDNISC